MLMKLTPAGVDFTKLCLKAKKLSAHRVWQKIAVQFLHQNFSQIYELKFAKPVRHLPTAIFPKKLRDKKLGKNVGDINPGWSSFSLNKNEKKTFFKSITIQFVGVLPLAIYACVFVLTKRLSANIITSNSQCTFRSTGVNE